MSWDWWISQQTSSDGGVENRRHATRGSATPKTGTGCGDVSVNVVSPAEGKGTMTAKPRIRVKMSKQRYNAEGLKLFDPFPVRCPWVRQWEIRSYYPRDPAEALGLSLAKSELGLYRRLGLESWSR